MRKRVNESSGEVCVAWLGKVGGFNGDGESDWSGWVKVWVRQDHAAVHH